MHPNWIVMLTLAAMMGVDGVSYPVADYSLDCQYSEDRDATPPSPTAVAAYNVTCTQRPSCTFFSDVLLVVKLKPTRLLWLDLLLNFYGTGFPHIVFFSSLRKGDTADGKYLTIGTRDVKVHLVDDNYGLADHETVAAAMRKWPGRFAGFFYLSDDVLLQFWKLLMYDKRGSWRVPYQLASTRRKQLSTVVIPSTVLDVMQRIASDARIAEHVARRVSQQSPPYSHINGAFYVPSFVEQSFVLLSSILRSAHCPNAYGTQLLLTYTDEGFTRQIIPGQFADRRNLQARHLLRDATLTWYWPVRASSETFARFMLVVHESTRLSPRDHFPADVLFRRACMNCAKYPPTLAAKRGGPFHSCFAIDPEYCGASMVGEGGGKGKAKERKRRVLVAETLPEVAVGGGNVYVPPDRMFVRSPLERDSDVVSGHEEAIFDTLYGLRNVTKCTARILSRFPRCCRMD